MKIEYKVKNALKRMFYIKVDKVHKIWVEDTGPVNFPVIVSCHGGPGGPVSSELLRRYIPKGFRMITFHQRGCGKSTPLGSLYNNKTHYLVKDMEKIRKHLGIKRWIVEGGSFGATLALAYAEAHPERVVNLVLIGLALMDVTMEQATVHSGTDVYEKWKIAPTEKASFKKYLKKLQGPERNKYAKKWAYEDKLFKIMAFKNKFRKRKVFKRKSNYKPWVLALLECYYYMNKGFFKKDQLIKNAYRLKNIPGHIVHGRYDLICSPSNSVRLSKVWPKGKLNIVNMAGHTQNNLPMYKVVAKIYKQLLRKYKHTKFLK